MPSRSQSAKSDSRLGHSSSSDQSSRNTHKIKSGAGVRRKKSSSKLAGSSHGQSKSSTPSLSVGFRIASVPQPNGKVARKESSGLSAPMRTPWRGGSGGTGGGSETGSDSGRGSKSSSKQNLPLTAQLTKSGHRVTLRGRTVLYKNFGTSSQMEEKTAETVPDPYLELTNIANEEIKLKEHADMLARTKMAVTGQFPGGAPKGVTSYQTSQPAPSAAVHAASLIQTASVTGREGVSSVLDSANTCKSPGCSGRTSVNGTSRSRAQSARSYSSGRSVVHASDCGDSGNHGGSGGGCMGYSQGERSVPLNSKERSERSLKQSKSQESTPPEQDDDDEDEDETGMPQAVRLPDAAPGESETCQEIIKRLHRTRMENIARNVEPSQLMQHLAQNGYFRYDYTGHSRTTMDNHNLKYGQKKGVERLYLWLSMYSPAEDSTPPKS